MTTEATDAALADLGVGVHDFGAGVTALGDTKPPRGLDARRLISELTREWERGYRRRLVVSTEHEVEEERPDIPLLSPSEVLARWNRDGATWLRSCSRLDLRAVVVASKNTTVGPALLTDGAFWPSLKARLRDRQSDQVLNAGYFIAGNLAWIEAAIRSRAELVPADVPPWWVAPGPNRSQLASVVARVAATATFGEVLEQLGLPDALPDTFLANVAKASQATQAAEVAALLSFLDHGAEMGNRAVIFDSTRDWVRRATQAGARFPRERLAIAELLRRRIGEVAAGRDDARWVGMEEERRLVRTWLIGEVFRVLFSHLVPHGQHEGQTEPRREFWCKYDQSVEKIWLLICDDHRDRLDGDEAVAKLMQHGLLEVLRFTGQAQQDGLWMHLRSSRGEQMTILEGNANMPIRIRLGALAPPLVAHGGFHPATGVVEYSRAKSLFPLGVTTMISHRGDWQSRATNTLRDLLVYAREAE